MVEEKLFAKMLATDAASVLGISLQLSNKKIKDANETFFKSQQRLFFGHNMAKKFFKFSFDKKTICFQIVKGGTGKTSITFSFAIRANLYGARVLCIDLDQQGNLTQAFGINAKDKPVMIDILKEKKSLAHAICNVSPGLDIVPSRIENSVLDNYLMLEKENISKTYSDLINRVKNDYDVIVLDCPPALGLSVAAATLASDMVVSPLTPEQFSLSGLNITYEEISSVARKYDKNLIFKIMLNKFDTRTALSTEVLSMVLNHPIYKDMIFKTFIRICQDFPNAINRGGNIYDDLKKSSAKEDVDLLTREILGLPISSK